MTTKALIARINRVLLKQGEQLRTTRSERDRVELGVYYVINLLTNTVTAKHVDPEAWAKELFMSRAPTRVTDCVDGSEDCHCGDITGSECERRLDIPNGISVGLAYSRQERATIDVHAVNPDGSRDWNHILVHPECLPLCAQHADTMIQCVDKDCGYCDECVFRADLAGTAIEA